VGIFVFMGEWEFMVAIRTSLSFSPDEHRTLKNTAFIAVIKKFHFGGSQTTIFSGGIVKGYQTHNIFPVLIPNHKK